LTGTLTHFYPFAAGLLAAQGRTGIFLARGLVLCLFSRWGRRIPLEPRGQRNTLLSMKNGPRVYFHDLHSMSRQGWQSRKNPRLCCGRRRRCLSCCGGSWRRQSPEAQVSLKEVDSQPTVGMVVFLFARQDQTRSELFARETIRLVRILSRSSHMLAYCRTRDGWSESSQIR
jgi:hypothetical protein